MTPEEKARLAEIEAREQAATPGPWEPMSTLADPVARVESRHWEDETPGVCGPHSRAWPMQNEDAEFIAASRADVPWLIALARQKDENFAEAVRRAEVVWAEQRDRAEQAEIATKAAEQKTLVTEAALAAMDRAFQQAADRMEQAEIERNEARAQLAAAIVILKALQVERHEWAAQLGDLSAPVVCLDAADDTFDADAIAAFAVVAPLLEESKP